MMATETGPSTQDEEKDELDCAQAHEGFIRLRPSTRTATLRQRTSLFHTSKLITNLLEPLQHCADFFLIHFKGHVLQWCHFSLALLGSLHLELHHARRHCHSRKLIRGGFDIHSPVKVEQPWTRDLGVNKLFAPAGEVMADNLCVRQIWNTRNSRSNLWIS